MFCIQITGGLALSPAAAFFGGPFFAGAFLGGSFFSGAAAVFGAAAGAPPPPPPGAAVSSAFSKYSLTYEQKYHHNSDNN